MQMTIYEYIILSCSFLYSLQHNQISSEGELSLSLFEDSFLDTFSGGKFNPRFLALTDDNNVAESSSEGVSLGILDMDNIEGTLVFLDVLDDADSSNVVSVLDETNVAGFKMGEGLDFASCNIVLEGITDLDFRVGESDCSGIVGNDVGDLVGTNGLGGNLQELELIFEE